MDGTDRFCENCGAALAEVRRVAVPRAGRSEKAPCADCGNETDADGYCTVCGHRRTDPDRDEADIDGVAVITDRGLEHSRNEDAAAAGIVVDKDTGRPYAIAVAVCDGVSTSDDAHIASAAAANAGVAAMLTTLAASRKARPAVLAGLADAAKAAAAAKTGNDRSVAPSCTYTAAAVVPSDGGHVQITIGNVGDGRAYWLPRPPAQAQQLTVDDSLAQELITAGASADSDAVQRGAHTLTRWLGADSDAKPWSDSSVQTITPEDAGWLLVCSDGLWNYLPDAADIAQLCTGLDAHAAARALVEHALNAGGQDNITVAIVPIGGLHEFG
ncbi:PP2C family protein-serine/threonine phosphatase [Mycobacterium sp. MMS18-G62]